MSLTKQISKTRLFTDIDTLEDRLATREDVVQPSELSPLRFEIIRERLKSKEGGAPFHMLPTMLQCLGGIKESLRSLVDNPPAPKTSGSSALVQEIKAFALACGASSIGYTKLPSRWVFKNKAVVYDNALVLSMEMDKEGIDSAPSLACMKTVMLTYRDLGRITNKIAALLRSYGFGAHGCAHDVG